VFPRFSNKYFPSVGFPVETEVKAKIKYSSWIYNVATMEIAVELLEKLRVSAIFKNQLMFLLDSI